MDVPNCFLRLRRRKDIRARMTHDDVWLTREAVAEYLGVTKKTIHQWMNRLEFPSYQLGRTRRFKKSEVDAWLAEHRDVKKQPSP